MAIEEKTQSEEQKAEEARDVDELKSKLFKTLDAEPDEGAAESEKKGEGEGEREPEAAAEEKPEGEEEGKPETGEEKGKEAEGDEEMVPRSKVEKMLARQEQRISQLTTRLRQVEGTAKSETSGGDAERDKLLKMSPTELKALKREVRLTQSSEKDARKVEQLVDLEFKIDEVIAEMPGRFVARQVELYNAMADEILEDEEIANVEKAAPEIRGIAQQIYARYPKLQRLEEGQAIALQLASEHYKALQKAGKGEGVGKGSTVEELRRKVNTLKRKTSLDTSSSRGLPESQDVHKLRERAFRGAENRDRIELIKKDPAFAIDAMIPEEFKENE